MLFRIIPSFHGALRVNAILLASLSSSVGIAQELVLEEIIVSASKRDASLMDLPQSIQAISGDDVKKLGLVGVEDVTSLVPNLNLNASPKRGGGFNIRGIAALSEQFSQFATVGLYLDETPISDGFANFDVALFDIERVEVLKGPQGTLYGEGSLGGTIRIITKQPELNDYSSEIFTSVETTRHGEMSYRLSGAVNLPIIEDTAALRITATRKEQGGYIDATSMTGSVEDDVNGMDSTYVKVAAKLQLSDRFEITPSLLYQKQEANAGVVDAIALPDLTGYANGPNDLDEDLKIYSIEANYDMGWADIVSNTSYLDREMSSRDDDILTNAIIGAAFAPSDVTTQLFDRSIETFTQELRVVSKGTNKVDWLVGAFYRDRKYSEDVSIENDVIGAIIGDPRVFTQDNKADFEQLAIFGELNYNLSDKLTLTAGARWFEEEINSNLDFGTFSLVTFGFESVLRTPQIKEDDVLFKLAASYQPTDSSTFYALFSQGVRPGGVNDRVLDILDLLTPEEEGALSTFDSDSTDNYEVGLKLRMFDNRLSLNMAAFYIDWKDIQLDRSFQNVPGPEFTVNAGKSSSTGLEIEAVASPSDALQIGAFLGVNEAEVDEETETSSGLIPNGAKLPFAPEFSAALFGEYSVQTKGGNTASVRVDWRHVGERKAGVDVVGDPGYELDDYQTLDIRAGLSVGNWTASIYAKNLTDERAEMDSFFFNDSLLGDALASFVRNRPRTFGVQLQASF
ncbi:TonB-dependent receptor [Kineobactrum salinum]|uniref:TonB-dependent receptor n=1 Tax=Kineobactrum salinum TaxID=2708301 RepID=A0A6C0U0B0_9GAMM|nr:TonB-dependent receptor [Kineobactrum salinum]QIB65446.1 TonB-dependent receptor [Kineobactrum salinum]